MLLGRTDALSATPIILASASPRRRELLSSLGLRFTVDPADIDEESIRCSTPWEQAVALSRAKALHVARRHAQGLVVGADTLVVIDGEVLGKPAGPAEARAMLRTLSGRTHEVYTGVTVVDAATGRHESAYERTEVTFRPLTDEQIDRYIATGEPFDKAGGYGIQGIGALLVARICGCYPNVVGLPLVALARLLEHFGVVVL